ncbi:uncharacterized protein [Typha latifolia]|uniref:uncharacterized protein n=1 Tax=Typha latifolia TaxID=4733 RepID=UPI003C2FD466
MAADSGMGFHQGMIPSSFYDRHMVSFQSGAGQPSAGMTSRGMSSSGGTSSSGSTAGMYLPRNMVTNMPAISPSGSSSSDVLLGSTPKYKHVTGTPTDWSPYELAILKEGLIRYAHEPNIMKYIKIAAMLPTRTIRDVALRCCWISNRDTGKRRKPDEHYTGKKLKDMKEKMVSSTPTANCHMASSSSYLAPHSLMMHHSKQNDLVSNEVPVVDSITQHLLNENERLLSQIATNLETLKMQENTDLFLHTSNNITTILNRMSQMPGIMCLMPPLPVHVNDGYLSSFLQLNRTAATYGAPSNSHLKQEPRC